jgi:hypothetical protein
MLEDLVFQLEKEKKSPQYIAGILKHVRLWWCSIKFQHCYSSGRN